MLHRFGTPGDYYHVTGATDDVGTGVSTVTKTVYRTKRMAELPTDIIRDIKIGVSDAQEIDISSVLILIDHRDLPFDFVYHPDDYIILYSIVGRQRQLGRRFNIQKLQTLETNLALIATARFIQGSALNAIYDLSVKDKLTMVEALSND